MKNVEKYEKEISKLVNEGKPLSCAIATLAGTKKSKPCQASEDCGECEKKCLEWMYAEYKEQILTDDEKEIVKEMCDVIHKFGCEINYVYKSECINGDCFIRTTFKNIVTGRLGIIDSPYFNNYMFKGMEIDKKYNLEELGISCQQKDS